MDDSPFDTDPNLWTAPKPAAPPPMPVAEVVATVPRWRMGLEPPPRIWTPFVAFGIFVSVILVAQITVVLINMGSTGGFDLNTLDLDLDDMLIVICISVATSAGTAIVAALFSPVPFAKRLGLMKPKIHATLWLIAPITSYALSLGFTSFIRAAMIQFNVEDPFPIDKIAEGHAMWKQILGIALVSLGAGFGEEFLFRGYMQTRLTQRIGFIGSVILVSVLFGIAHLNLAQGIFAAMLGMFVGTLAHRTGSIWPAIWCHAFSNFCALVVTFNLPDMTAPQYLAIVGLCMGAVIGGTVLMLWLTRNGPASNRISLAARL